MVVYRISKIKYAEDLSGEGAKKVGGRWNSKGIPVIYTSSTVSLALTEVIVNLGMIPFNDKTYAVSHIYLPDSITYGEIDLKSLPDKWNTYPHPNELKLLGDAWAKENLNLVLKEPSAVVIGEFNYLINPLHKDFLKVTTKTSTFPFDPRLLDVLKKK